MNRIIRGLYILASGIAQGNIDLGAFSLLFGSASGTSDVRFRRTATKTLTVDDGAAGSATLTVTGNLSATNVIDSPTFRPSATGEVSWNGRTRLLSPADGQMTFRNDGNTQTVLFAVGAGSPEAAITAPVGSIYFRTNGGAATSFYVKESGTGNTGWVGK